MTTINHQQHIEQLGELPPHLQPAMRQTIADAQARVEKRLATQKDAISDPLEGAAEDFTIDLSGWRMKHYRAFINAGKDGDLEGLSEIMASVIQRWPFVGNPNALDTYDDLSPHEWQAAVKAVSEVARALFR